MNHLFHNSITIITFIHKGWLRKTRIRHRIMVHSYKQAKNLVQNGIKCIFIWYKIQVFKTFPGKYQASGSRCFIQVYLM